MKIIAIIIMHLPSIFIIAIITIQMIFITFIILIIVLPFHRLLSSFFDVFAKRKQLRWIVNSVQICSEAYIKTRNLKGPTNVCKYAVSNTSQVSYISNKTKCQYNLKSDGFRNFKHYLASIWKFCPIDYCSFGSCSSQMWTLTCFARFLLSL